jgi:DNA-binding NtrC family response regulator
MVVNKEILLVEDDRDLLDFAGELLMELGYQVFAASSGEKALKLMEHGIQPDLILSDIRLPGGIDGIELAKEAKARRPDIKVLLTSGYDEYTVNTVIKGDFPFIEKPYRISLLNEAVQAVLKDVG